MKFREEIEKELSTIGSSSCIKANGKNPFTIPLGYFENLESNLILTVKASADYQTVNEELAGISPFLKNIAKTNTYSVPAHYLETINFSTPKTNAKIIPITEKKWFRFTAAAVVFGLLMISGLEYINKTSISPVATPHNWVEQKMKKVSTEEINNFINLTEADMITKENFVLVDNTTDLDLLLNDISIEEIQQFFNETNFTEETTLR